MRKGRLVIIIMDFIDSVARVLYIFVIRFFGFSFGLKLRFFFGKCVFRMFRILREIFIG